MLGAQFLHELEVLGVLVVHVTGNITCNNVQFMEGQFLGINFQTLAGFSCLQPVLLHVACVSCAGAPSPVQGPA